MQDKIFYKGEGLLFENSNRPNWIHRKLLLTQNFLIIYKTEHRSFLSEEEDGRIHLLGLNSFASPTKEDFWGWQVDMLIGGKHYAFKVKTREEAEQWKKMLRMGASWTNYEHFCEFEQVKPWDYFLQWASKGKDHLDIFLKGCNSFAVLEFIRDNPYITGVTLSSLNGQVTILTRILSYFPTQQLREINLSSCKIDDKIFELSQKSISANRYLESLDLSNNLLTSSSIPILFSIFALVPGLLQLNISKNDINDEGAGKLLPHIMGQLAIEEINIADCNLRSIKPISHTLRIKNLVLKKLVLDNNHFSNNDKRKLLMKIREKRWKGYDITMNLNPIDLEERLLKVLDFSRSFHLERELINSDIENKPPPISSKHRMTIDHMTSQVEVLFDKDEIFVEDLEEMAKQLSKLDFQFPKSKIKVLEDLIDEKIEDAIEEKNFYCLEKLMKSQQLLGKSNAKAEVIFEELKIEVQDVITTLEYALTPAAYKEENIETINDLLDGALQKAEFYGLKGELISTARLLQAKRNEMAYFMNNE